METILAIANYFGITIDELSGYQSDQDDKINQIIQIVDSYNIKSRGDDQWVDECILILREGLTEFPKNERLMITLGDTLAETGWRSHHEWLYYDDEGFIQHKYDKHKKNEYWSEVAKIGEYLVNNACDNTVVTKAIRILVLLYRNCCETEKAMTYAMKNAFNKELQTTFSCLVI